MRQLRRAFVRALLMKTFAKMLARQLYVKITKFSRRSKGTRDFCYKIAKGYEFLKYMSEYNLHVIDCSRHCLEELASRDVQEVSIYGAGDIAEIFYDLTFEIPVKITVIYDDSGKKTFLGFNVIPVEESPKSREKMIVASVLGFEGKMERLRKLGVVGERIVALGQFGQL